MTNINDQNFKEEVAKIEKLVLVDFYADWCPPCNKLGPVLEKVADELSNEIVLIKANVDDFPKTSQEFAVSKIPFVVLLKDGNMIDSFLGFKDEEDVMHWIQKQEIERKETPNNEQKQDQEETDVDNELLMNYEDYAAENDFILNPNKKLVEGILKGLVRNEEIHGARYCPCRRITGNKQEDKSIICPCVYHKEEIDNDGKCMCGLFMKS